MCSTKCRILICIIITTNLLSCKKNYTDLCQCCGHHTTYHSHNPELSAYMFGTGSYWVYQRESDQLLDSQCVTYGRKQDGITSGNCGASDQYRFLISEIASNINDSVTKYSMYTIPAVNNNGNQIALTNIPPFTLGDRFQTMAFRLSRKNSGILPSSPYFIGYSDSMLVGGIVYYTVTSFHVAEKDSLYHSFPYEMDLHFARNVGIIKKTEYTSSGLENWNLIRHNTHAIF
jgi:hypothetical protein